MPTATIRISERSRKVLGDIARQEGASLQSVMDQAIEHYRRQHFLEGLSEDFAALRKSPELWEEELKEREEWDTTLADGADK